MIETYSSYLSNTHLLSAYKLYQQVFFTSRNGIFYVPIFICLGHLVYDYRNHRLLYQFPFLKLVGCFAFWLLEGYFIFINPGLDKNFFLGLLPFSFFLFNWVSRTSFCSQKEWGYFKHLSAYFFYLHPIFIELGFYLMNRYPLQLWEKGIFVALFAIIGTWLLSIFLIRYKTLKP